jgi:MFS family permease
MNRQRLINLLAAISAITVFSFTLGLMFPLLALIMEKQGVSPRVIGLNTAMQPLGIVASVFTTAPLVRRFGAKAATIGAALGTSVIILAYPWVPIFWWWFALRICHGFFVSTLFAVSEAWVVRFAEGPHRSRILALYTSVLAASFGGGPALMSVTGNDTALPFIIGAIILLVATIPIFFVHDEDIDEADESAMSVLGFVRKAPILLLAVGLFAIIDAANLSFLPVYGVKKGMTEEMAALALTAFIVGNTVLQFPIGWLADHFNKLGVMAACAVITACASAGLPLTFGTPAYWLLLPVVGAASCGIYTVALAALGDRFSGHELVTGTASFSTTWGLGALLGSLVAGWAFATFGPDGLPLSMSLIFAAFLSVLALTRLFHDKRQGAPHV